MPFDIRKLDNLSYDDVEPLLVDYINDVIQEFVNSTAGQAHINDNPTGGDWIGTFIEMGYFYGEKTLPKMTKSDVQELMEYTLPRKITLMDRSDTDGAVEELIAFWTFLKEVYKFRSAGAIVKYLTSIKDKFADWMFDPSRGGIAKSFMMQGVDAGHDMTTQEGIEAFQSEYNQNLEANPASNLLAGSSFGGPQLAPMVAPPPELKGMLEMLGVDLPEEGTMVNPMELLASIKSAAEAFDEQSSDGRAPDPMRAMILGAGGDIPDLSDAHASILDGQEITETEPGTILKDFEMLLEFLGPNGIAVGGKRHLFTMQALVDINDRLSKPITLDLKRPVQKSYPPINGLYLLLRATGLVSVVAKGKKYALIINQDLYDIWKTLNPSERYFTLLEAWLVRGNSEIMGDDRGGPLTDGDRCFRSWESIASQKQHSFAKYKDQDALKYYPGFHSIVLMEMFGFIKITSGKPQKGKGWRIKKIEATPFGKAMMLLHKIAFLSNGLTWNAEQDVLHPYNELQSFFSPYFPAWQAVWSLPKSEFRSGRHIFKVRLGKCWRRIAIDADASLYVLSRFILDSVDFDYDHMDQFTYKDAMGRKVEVMHPAGDMGGLSTDEVLVGELPIPVGGTMEYVFDFGDWWKFEVQLESVISPETEQETDTPAAPATSKKAASKKGKKAKASKKKSKRKSPGDIIESHGDAPEQYPSYDDEW